MIVIEEVKLTEEKANICNKILRALPDWFGIESSIVDYVKDVQEMPLVAAFDKDLPVGFLAIMKHNEYTSEVHVMGILPEYHRKNIGKQLLEAVNPLCSEYLTVKTLAACRENEYYARTRQFYLAMGFKPLEVFPELWGKDNPCLMMIKDLKR